MAEPVATSLRAPLKVDASSHLRCELDHNRTMNGPTRSQIQPGMRVRIVEKQNQRTGKLTEGIVRSILTKSPQHPHGIKVMLENAVVGRVKEIVKVN